MTAPSQPRQPLLSRLMIFPLHLLAAILHIFIQPLGREIEPVISLLVTGGFFGLAAWSVFFYWVALKACAHAVGVLGIPDINLVHYVGLPLLAVYIVQILILDDAHTRTSGSYVTGPIRPQNGVERTARKFYDSAMKYNPIRCVP